jgi:hypothetical protein
LLLFSWVLVKSSSLQKKQQEHKLDKPLTALVTKNPISVLAKIARQSNKVKGKNQKKLRILHIFFSLRGNLGFLSKKRTPGARAASLGELINL